MGERKLRVKEQRLFGWLRLGGQNRQRGTDAWYKYPDQGEHLGSELRAKGLRDCSMRESSAGRGIPSVAVIPGLVSLKVYGRLLWHCEIKSGDDVLVAGHVVKRRPAEPTYTPLAKIMVYSVARLLTLGS